MWNFLLCLRGGLGTVFSLRKTIPLNRRFGSVISSGFAPVPEGVHIMVGCRFMGGSSSQLGMSSWRACQVHYLRDWYPSQLAPASWVAPMWPWSFFQALGDLSALLPGPFACFARISFWIDDHAGQWHLSVKVLLYPFCFQVSPLVFRW